MNQQDTPTLEHKTHDAARYGERWAARLDARWDQVRYRSYWAARSHTYPHQFGPAQARESYERTLALYEAEKAQALFEAMAAVVELA